jgi:hypothetical protein
MKVEFYSPIRSLQGKAKSSDYAFSNYGGRTICRSSGTTCRRPATTEQALVHQFLAAATACWDELSQAQRDAWERYATLHFARRKRGVKVVPSGIATYVRANHSRQLLGLPLLENAPLGVPPTEVRQLTQVGGTPDNTMSIVLQHFLPDPAGHLVLVRATPPMPTRARRPQKGMLRYVRSFGPDSSAPLPASGGAVTFSPVRHEVQAGQRYGVEVRIVRIEDGLMSMPVYGDFVKSA